MGFVPGEELEKFKLASNRALVYSLLGNTMETQLRCGWSRAEETAHEYGKQPQDVSHKAGIPSPSSTSVRLPSMLLLLPLWGKPLEFCPEPSRIPAAQSHPAAAAGVEGKEGRGRWR